jgi:hypothetical protein
MYEAINPATAITPPLKLKYRTRYTGSQHPSGQGGNSGKKQLAKQGWGHRRRSYGPFDTFVLDARSNTKK